MVVVEAAGEHLAALAVPHPVLAVFSSRDNKVGCGAPSYTQDDTLMCFPLEKVISEFDTAEQYSSLEKSMESTYTRKLGVL